MKKLRQIYLTWQLLLLQTYANLWFTALRRYKGAVCHHSPWWNFIYYYQVARDLWLMKFIHGRYRFSPMQCLHFPEETITIWDYSDRLILSLLLKIITPTFKHIISKHCLHLGGPNQVKPALAQVKNAVKNGCFFLCA